MAKSQVTVGVLGSKDGCDEQPWPLRPAAYSVARAPDGDVTVTIRRFSDAAALERSLADAGIDAEVHYDGSLSAGESVVPDAPEILPYVPVDPDDPDASGALSVPDPSTVVQPGPNGEVRTGDVGPVDPWGSARSPRPACPARARPGCSSSRQTRPSRTVPSRSPPPTATSSASSTRATSPAAGA